MHKSLLSFAVCSIISLPTLPFTDSVASGATFAAVPASSPAATYNLGLFSQYVFCGLTQTEQKPALQAGLDYAHASGVDAGFWALNISWLEAGANYDGASLELDVYAGHRSTSGDTVIGYDLGLLNYIYPSSKTAADKANTGFTEPYTLETT